MDAPLSLSLSPMTSVTVTEPVTALATSLLLRRPRRQYSHKAGTTTITTIAMEPDAMLACEDCYKHYSDLMSYKDVILLEGKVHAWRQTHNPKECCKNLVIKYFTCEGRELAVLEYGVGDCGLYLFIDAIIAPLLAEHIPQITAEDSYPKVSCKTYVFVHRCSYTG